MKRSMSATAAFLLGCSILQAQIELRLDEPLPPGDVVAIDEQGVTVRAESAQTVISWDRVRRVSGDHAAEAANYADVADRLWRARSRIERGDWRLGEPLFERLFATYGTLTGPASAVTAEGLLRCRLRRGAQAGAVEPWLALVRIRRMQVHAVAGESGETATAVSAIVNRWSGGHIDLPPILDAQSSLAPALPPIWLSGPAVEALANSPAIAITGVGEPVAEQLADLYHAAAAFESGQEVLLPEAGSNHSGVALVRDVVAARVGDNEERQAARDALQSRLAADPAPWIQVWCHAAIGRSLIREDDQSLRRKGVLHLLRIPAGYGAEHPYLAGVALAESAVVLANSGELDSAAALRAELERSFPDHPALTWPPLRNVVPTGPPPADGARDDATTLSSPTDSKGAA